MQETLRTLIETEKTNGEIDLLDGELAKFPVEEQQIADEIQRCEREVGDTRSLLEREELEERKLESQMQDQEELLLRLNHQTAQVSSNQAYTALQHELDAAGAAKTEFETLALEHMEAIDQAKQKLSDVRARQNAIEERAPGRLQEIDARRKDVESKRAEAAFKFCLL